MFLQVPHWPFVPTALAVPVPFPFCLWPLLIGPAIAKVKNSPSMFSSNLDSKIYVLKVICFVWIGVHFVPWTDGKDQWRRMTGFQWENGQIQGPNAKMPLKCLYWQGILGEFWPFLHIRRFPSGSLHHEKWWCQWEWHSLLGCRTDQISHVWRIIGLEWEEKNHNKYAIFFPFLSHKFAKWRGECEEVGNYFQIFYFFILKVFTTEWGNLERIFQEKPTLKQPEMG